MAAETQERPGDQTAPEPEAAARAEARRLLTAVRHERGAFREEQEALRQTLVAFRHELTALPASIGAAVDTALSTRAPDFRTVTAQLQALADTGSLRPPRRPPAPSPGRVLLTVCALLALCGAALFLFTPDPAPDRRPRRVEPPAFLDPPPPARVPVPVPPPAAPQPEEVKDADA